jgi:MFS transporter, ACS family, allantoate permease
MDFEEKTVPMTHVHELSTKVLTKQTDGQYDIALSFLRDQDPDALQYTDEEARRVLWKLDLTILPMMTICFVLNFVDKGILSNASIFGLFESLNIDSKGYSWLVSAFYFGYLAGLPLTLYVLHLIPAGRWLVINLFLWGLRLMAMAGAKDFASGFVCRFFIGFFEACVNPVMVLLTAQYYTRREHALRSCIWWAGNPIGAVISDFVAYGLGFSHGALPPWKYMFICFGSLTILYSLFMFIFFPESPMTMKRLTPRERTVAVLRVIDNQTGIAGNHFKWIQVKEALLDPQVWLFVIITYVQCIPGGGLTNFSKLIIESLGYDNLQTIIMGLPSDAIQFASVIIAGVCGSYFTNARCIVMFLSNVPCLVGACLVYFLPVSHKLQRLAGIYITFTNTVSYIMCMSMVASNLAGMTKKNTAACLMFLAYCAGNLTAPHFFSSGNYLAGFESMIASFALMIFFALVLMAYLIWENMRRNKIYGKPTIEEVPNLLEDMTDKEQRESFRYRW